MPGWAQVPVTAHLSVDSALPPGFDKKTPREAGSARETGASGEGSIMSSIGGTPQGVKNAFQALNTYTLEEASKDDAYPVPPAAVREFPTDSPFSLFCRLPVELFFCEVMALAPRLVLNCVKP